MIKNAKPSMLDITVLDVYDGDDEAYDIVDAVTEMGNIDETTKQQMILYIS